MACIQCFLVSTWLAYVNLIKQSTMKTAVAFLALATGASAFAPSASFSKATDLKGAADYKGVIGSDSLETGKMMVRGFSTHALS